MIARLCSRCQSVLHREDEGSLIFCWYCGAPQVQLSEELRDQINKQLADAHAGTSMLDPLPLPSSPGNSIIWPGAIQCAGLAGIVAAVFALIAFVAPAVDILSFFWLVGAPAFVLVIYSSRFRQSHITAGFGARLGVLSGLSILLANSALNTVGLLFLRFVFHSGGPIDAQLDNTFRPIQLLWVTRLGPIANTWFANPDFRVGMIFLGGGFVLLFYLLFSATAGAFAGYIRSRSPR